MKFTPPRLLSTVILFVVPVIVGIAINMDMAKPRSYTNLELLPILTGVFFIILQLANRKISISFPLICVLGLFYIRNVLAPLALYMGNYRSYFSMVTKDSIDSSIMLLLLETVILTLYSIHLSKKADKHMLNIPQGLLPISKKSNRRYANFLFFMLSLSAILILLNPNFLGDYVSIFSSQNSREMQIGTNATGPLYTIFTVIFPITYLSLSLYVISFYAPKKQHYIVPIIVSIGIPFLFMNNSDAFTLITVFCLGLTALKFKTIPKRMFISMGVVAMLLITIYMFSNVANASFQSDQKTVGEKVSEIMQGYFPGVSNASGIFTMNEHDKWHTLFFDLYVAIPFRQTLFGIQGDDRLVTLFTDDNDASSQVIPCSAQLYYYFGIFGLLLECLFIKFAFSTYKKAERGNNVYVYYARILLFMYLIMTPTVYNTTLFLVRFFITLMPMLLIYKALQGNKLSVPQQSKLANMNINYPSK